jgi:sulfide:quinone oxidoreductase
MSKRIVILGGGTGGTMMANRLRRVYTPEEAEIAVVDLDDRHVYQPGLLFVPFGLTDAEDIVRSRRRQLREGIDFHRTEVDRVELEADSVHLANGATLPTTCSSSPPAAGSSPRRPRG